MAIYVISVVGRSACKVGISWEPDRRVQNLQTASDETLNVFWAGRLHKFEATELESTFHRRMAGTKGHLRGEWYRLSPMLLVGAILDLASELRFEVQPDRQYGRTLDRIDRTDAERARHDLWNDALPQFKKSSMVLKDTVGI